MVSSGGIAELKGDRAGSRWIDPYRVGSNRDRSTLPDKGSIRRAKSKFELKPAGSTESRWDRSIPVRLERSNSDPSELGRSTVKTGILGGFQAKSDPCLSIRSRIERFLLDPSDSAFHGSVRDWGSSSRELSVGRFAETAVAPCAVSSSESECCELLYLSGGANFEVPGGGPRGQVVIIGIKAWVYSFPARFVCVLQKGYSCCYVACMASVVARCVLAMVTRLTVDSLTMVFTAWRTVAGKFGVVLVVVISLGVRVGVSRRLREPTCGVAFTGACQTVTCLYVCRFITPEDSNMRLNVCRFMTPEDLNTCLYVCRFMTPEDLNMCLNVCRFMTPEDLNMCLYVCHFMTPEDLNMCLNVCRFMTPEDLNMCLY
ncbi:hypothetical protein Taro_031670, partial [Colocasia esculenta]|nr:hypothetical protein [Colocasia esculenta]